MFDYITAGESHGPALTAIIKDPPAGLELDVDEINYQLRRRQGGYGRGGRMSIESDSVEITSGVRFGKTLGSPLTMTIENKDWENWQDTMKIEKKPDDFQKEDRVEKPRPGHADLPGALKYNFDDMRNVLERASARETAARTAVAAVCRQFLSEFDIKIFSHVIQIGEVKAPGFSGGNVEEFFSSVDKSEFRCADEDSEKEMKQLIDDWREKGDSAGGVFEVVAAGIPAGLGSHIHWDSKLDAKLARAFMSIQAIKGVEFGLGFEAAGCPGSEVHDEIDFEDSRGFYRRSNNSGGFEGGITIGENIKIRAAMKPIPTLATPLKTVDYHTKEDASAAKERSDICAVPAASIVGEAVTAIKLAQSFGQKFGGDSLSEIRRNFNSYKKHLQHI